MLDTNICIYIIKNRPKSVKQKFQEFSIGELCISSITVSELMYGAFKSQFVEKNLKAIESFLMPFEIVDYDYMASIEYGKIRANLERKGIVIGNLIEDLHLLVSYLDQRKQYLLQTQQFDNKQLSVLQS